LTPEENLSADEQNLLTPAGSLAARPSLDLPFWDFLAAAARKDRRAQERCKRLKQDWERKDDVLGHLQRGVLIHWLDDHSHVRDQIISRYTPPPDSGILTRGDQRPSGRVLPITREWFQDIKPAIEEDEKADAEARATPDRVEIHLYDPPRRSSIMFCSSGVEIKVHFLDAPDRPLVIPRDRVEINLPDTPEQWRPDDVEAMRHKTVVVFPLNTDASWEQARSIAQKLQGVAASIRLIDTANPRGHIQNELAACELWGFWLSRCRFGDHWTVGDERFRNDCKEHQNEQRLTALHAYKARKTNPEDPSREP